MRLLVREIYLAVVTGAVAAAILTPLFFILHALVTTDLEVAVAAVVVSGILLAYLMNKETIGA